MISSVFEMRNQPYIKAKSLTRIVFIPDGIFYSISLILLVITAFTCKTHSQTTEFVSVYGNSTYNEGVATLQMNDSTFIVIGNSAGFTSNSAPYFAYIDRYGSLLRDVMITRPWLVMVTAASLNNDMVCLTGYAIQQGTYRNMFIKTDIQGNVVVEKYWGNSGWSFARAMVISSEGKIYIAGETTDSVYGAKQASLSCLDTSGTVLWQKSFGGQDNDVFLAIDTGHSNSLIIAGYSQSYGAYGDSALYIINTDHDGNIRWETIEDYPGPDMATGIRPDLSGGYILCGQSSFWPSYGRESFILRMDSAGTVEWKNRLGSEDEAAFYSIVQMPDSTYRMAGFWTKGQHGFGKKDFFMQNADAGGWWSPFLPAQIFGGLEDDIAVNIIALNNKGYLLTGTTKSFGAGSTHIMIIKTDSTGAIGPNLGLQTGIRPISSSLKDDGLLLYPNPAKDRLFIRSISKDTEITAALTIRDISGRVVKSMNIKIPEDDVIILDISDLQKGIYLFCNGNNTIKFIRQ